MALVVGIGEACVDLVGVAPHLEREGRTELAQVSVQGGGAVANALVAAASLGAQARMAARVADDEFGRMIVRGLRAAGVDCEFVRVAGGHLSPFAFRAHGDDRRRRTIFHTHGDAGALATGDLDLNALLADAKALILASDGIPDEAMAIAAAEHCNARGVPVILDAGGLHEGMGELVALADVLIASERFVSEVAPRGELEDSLRELSRLGPRGAVITLGEAGSVGLFGDTMIEQPAFAVDVVDTSGAGDVYHGAFAAAWVQGHPPERCMAFASAAAALACRELGPRGGIPEIDEVHSLLGWQT
jgi:sugar/nucleoside kinase (ribokinase family)